MNDREALEELGNNIYDQPENKFNEIAKAVCSEIKKLPEGTEFTIQRFLINHCDLRTLQIKNIFSIMKLLYIECEKNNVLYVPKDPEACLGMPWCIPVIKKDKK